MNDGIDIVSHLRRGAARHPKRLAMVSPKGTLTLRELDRLSDFCARGLFRAGIGRDARVVLMVRPGAEFLVLAFGLIKLGAVLVVVDPGMGWRNLGKCLAEAEPEGFVGIPIAQTGRSLLGWARKTVKTVVTVGSPRLWRGFSFAQILKNGRAASPTGEDKRSGCDQDRTVAIVFTSGSTGVPKGVLYTHRMLSAQADLLRLHFGIQEGETDLATFPLFGLFDPAWGATTVFPEMDFTQPGAANPTKIISAIDENAVTHMFGSPALLDRLGRHGEEKRVRLKTVKRVLSAGAPVSTKILARFQKMLNDGVQIHTPYGATEALPVCSIASHELLSESGSARGHGVCVGRPLPGVSLAVIAISDDPVEQWSDQLLVGDGQIGELVVSGDNVSRGYYGRPAANRLAKITAPEGRILHRMGDLGWLDDQGRFWFCGRKSHRVVTPAGTLFTVACEGIFNQHPAVFRTALVGVGDPPNQTPVLCVELEDKGKWKGSEALGRSILELGEPYPQTCQIAALLFHHKFPVDIRHNAKIFREKLAVWAASRLRKAGWTPPVQPMASPGPPEGK